MKSVKLIGLDLVKEAVWGSAVQPSPYMPLVKDLKKKRSWFSIMKERLIIAWEVLRGEHYCE